MPIPSNDSARAAMDVVAFEHYLLTDTWADIPMGDCYRFRFAGRCHEQHLRSAFDTALTRHPLMRSLVSGHPLLPTWALK